MKKVPILPDTNFILRYLLHDVDGQFETASAFFEDVRSGKSSASISESVLVECIYILVKHYGVPRPETASTLSGLLQYKGVVNPDKEVLTKALAIFADSSLDPVDCILTAQARTRGTDIMTFDNKLKKLVQKQQ